MNQIFTQAIKNMKRLILLIVIALVTYGNASGQIKFDDPLTVIKDPHGKKLTKDDIMQIMNSGKKFTLSPVKNGDSTIYHLQFLSDEELAKTEVLRTDLIKALEGKSLAPFNLSTLDGEVVSESSIKGKVTVLNFWYTGCKPCIREMPELNKLVDKFEGEVNFLALALDLPEEVEAFLTKREFKYRHLPDSKSFIESLGINVYPTHLIIDKEGKVRKVIFGASENIKDELEKIILMHLNRTN